MLSSTHYVVYDNNPWENCNPLCSSISPCYNAYDSWLEMMADDGHERLPNMGPGNLLSAQHACLRHVRWSHFQPISSSLTAQPSFLFQDVWLRDVTAFPRGTEPPSSPKPPPHNPAVGPGRTTVAVRRWKGWGVTWTALLQLWKSIPSFSSLSTAFVFIPAQEKTSGCLAEGAQKVKIWSNLEAGKFARAARSRALLSHLEWELQAPDCHIKRCQTLWVCFKRKCWLSFQRNVGQKSTPGCRSQADSQT